MPTSDAIYVECPVRGSVDDLWEHTQQPEDHARWDLRFSDIEYSPREDGGPQRFTYRTQIVPGLAVEGTGESVGTREGAGDGVVLARHDVTLLDWRLVTLHYRIET